MRKFTSLLAVVVIASMLLTACPTPTVEPTPKPEEPTATPEVADYGKVAFISTQCVPVEEAEKMRNVILADFSGTTEFIPADYATFEDTVLAEVKAGKGTIDVIGALHGQFPTLLDANALQDLTPLLDKVKGRGIPDAYMELGKLGTDKQYFIPWMQATYIVAANKKALDYLPEGADPNALTWEQYRDWAKNIYEATGEKKVGFPVNGLIHRFLEGYIYPSYTGGMVTTFKSAEAVEMWKFIKDLWQYVHPQSMVYEFMQEPLMSEEVWVAWDHTARLINAFKERPDDFVALPAPSGPKGKGFMPVVVGLAIPVTAPNPEGAAALIEYLTRPETQLTTLREVGFFPVIDVEYPDTIAAGIRAQGEAVSAQAAAADAIPAMLPVGLGPRSGEINKIYRDAFNGIVVDGKDIETVLEAEAQALQTLLNETGAPCWPPDPPSTGACQVK